MSQTLQMQQQEFSIPQILRTYGKQFTQIRERYSDGDNGRCAVGVIMSYYGWGGSDNFNVVMGLFGALDELKYAGIDEDLLINLNDSGYTFDEIADYIDTIQTANRVIKENQSWGLDMNYIVVD
jgi:hypothetical protein